MVAIKSLAVLFFAVAATAVPVAHDPEDNQGVKNKLIIDQARKECASQKQELYCCNQSKNAGSGLLRILDDVSVSCNSITGNVIAASALNGQSACNAKLACCDSDNKQTGTVNVNAGCQAVSGLF